MIRTMIRPTVEDRYRLQTEAEGFFIYVPKP